MTGSKCTKERDEHLAALCLVISDFERLTRRRKLLADFGHMCSPDAVLKLRRLFALQDELNPGVEIRRWRRKLLAEFERICSPEAVLKLLELFALQDELKEAAKTALSPTSNEGRESRSLVTVGPEPAALARDISPPSRPGNLRKHHASTKCQNTRHSQRSEKSTTNSHYFAIEDDDENYLTPEIWGDLRALWHDGVHRETIGAELGGGVGTVSRPTARAALFVPSRKIAKRSAISSSIASADFICSEASRTDIPRALNAPTAPPVALPPASAPRSRRGRSRPSTLERLDNLVRKAVSRRPDLTLDELSDELASRGFLMSSEAIEHFLETRQIAIRQEIESSSSFEDASIGRIRADQPNQQVEETRRCGRPAAQSSL